MAIETQQDLVTQHLQSLQAGEMITEKLKIPGIADLFVVEGGSEATVTTAKMRIPVTNKVSVTTRAELMRAILQCVQSSPHITGVKWDVGEDYVEVTRDSEATVSFAEGVTEDRIQAVLMNTIRSRASVDGFEWKFGAKFISLVHENRQYI